MLLREILYDMDEVSFILLNKAVVVYNMQIPYDARAHMKRETLSLLKKN